LVLIFRWRKQTLTGKKTLKWGKWSEASLHKGCFKKRKLYPRELFFEEKQLKRRQSKKRQPQEGKAL
jgi:hypothetical protein